MFINDVIRQVDNYYPNEYDLTEKYVWCDEVSAMLCIEDRQYYTEKILPVTEEGTIVLPEDIGIEYIHKIIYNNQEIPKQDARTFGKRTINIKGLNNTVEKTDGVSGGNATVIYLAPYKGLRVVRYKGLMREDSGNNTLYIGECDYIPGDVLNVIYNGNIVAVAPLLSVSYDPDSKLHYKLKCGDGSLNDILSVTGSVEFEGIINRSIVEKTVCDAPYDSMYTDYLLAKINLYQRDNSAYSQFMASFNSKLLSYKKFITERMPKDDGQFTNWW